MHVYLMRGANPSSTGERDRLADNFQRLWKRMGGTQEGLGLPAGKKRGKRFPGGRPLMLNWPCRPRRSASLDPLRCIERIDADDKVSAVHGDYEPFVRHQIPINSSDAARRMQSSRIRNPRFTGSAASSACDHGARQAGCRNEHR